MVENDFHSARQVVKGERTNNKRYGHPTPHSSSATLGANVPTPTPTPTPAATTPPNDVGTGGGVW